MPEGHHVLYAHVGKTGCGDVGRSAGASCEARGARYELYDMVDQHAGRGLR